RPDLVTDPRFDSDANRAANLKECMATLDEIFAGKTLEEWKAVLATQEGQWNIIQKAGELASDEQTLANNFMQDVDYGSGRTFKMVSTPIQFDRQVLSAGPSPDLGAHNDEVLGELGLSEDEIIDLKIAGIVY
ncbi:MAG: CoA transferase, partial [Acidimicrobiia bacterium]